jgi:glycine/D-amino acid oxidase-like deaminating enzyme
MLPIEQSCFWLATRAGYVDNPALSGAQSADFAVIGAGFTGLWSAYFLKRINPSADVVVVERSVTGYGASGRNAGIVSTSIDHTHNLAIGHFGKAEAARLARLGLQNIEELDAFAQGCDFERTGQLQVALTPGHMEECKRNLDVASELGIEGYRLLDKDEIQNEVNSPLYLGGLFVPGGGNLNPIKLIDKLKQDLLARGVRIFENTKVESLDNGTVNCAGGTIRAKRIILATDAYSHHLMPDLLFRFIPLYDYILVSEPLNEEQKKAVKWHNRQGMVDGRTFFNYYRLTADDRVLWGTSEAVYYPPNKVDESCDHSQGHYDTLRASWKRHFPDAADLQFPYAWGGPIASTTRLTPFFGTAYGDTVVYGLGYTGHGIGTTRIAGNILAHIATTKESELLSLKMVTNKPFPYPPEPIRSLSVNAVTASLQKVDRGESPNLLLRMLDVLGIGFSS